MDLPAYSQYESTDLYWIKELPKGWADKKLKFICSFGTGWTPPTKMQEYFSGDNTWVTIGDMSRKYITESKTNITDQAVSDFNFVEVPKGALLYSFKLSVGKVAFAGKPLYTNEAIFFVLPVDTFDIRYLYYLFPLAIIQNASENIYGAKILNQDLIKNAFLIEPPLDEQTKIADFLDYKTQQIDQLIEKKKVLIEKLNEQRIAVITQAVTKGLEKNAKMKPSGVDWLGDVPEHWDVKRLRFVINTTKGYAFKSVYFSSEGVLVVKASDIKNKTIIKSDVYLPEIFSQTHAQVKLQGGDIVISTVGSTPDVLNSAVGQIGKVPNECHGALLNQNTVILKPHSGLNNDYLMYLLSATAFREHLDLHAHGTANQASLSLQDILNFKAAIPPNDEQISVTSFLDKSIRRIDGLIKSASNVIRRMEEYRVAIITASVTGKIDVRNLEIPKEVA